MLLLVWDQIIDINLPAVSSAHEANFLLSWVMEYGQCIALSREMRMKKAEMGDPLFRRHDGLERGKSHVISFPNWEQ